ncbi:casein kinase I isoform delta-A [Stachybotrys elegans]|uniref:non-specific serine/threonine protein kinase n=1 Tax=Stachybotrys elegans TaxID=80388 RepID=A0A8K0T8U8_9HYPO|nr:casein kinase I isoform delta-A [Stachybotrys elegans]
MKDIIINGQFHVQARVGKGGQSVAYSGLTILLSASESLLLTDSGTDLFSNQKVAIKLTGEVHADQARDEEEIYISIAGGTGIPNVKWFGHQGPYSIIVLDLLGPSLDDLHRYCGGKFSLKTVLMIADQALYRLQHIHSKGYLHRDVKPANLLMGCGKKGNVVYLIDYALAVNISGIERREQPRGVAWAGTPDFASLTCHNRYGQSWGDDLESLLYSLVFLATGTLPWYDVPCPSDAQLDEQTKLMKMRPPESICEGLPRQFARFLTIVRGLRYGEKPNYTHLRRMFNLLFVERGFKHDFVFDWTEKLYNETIKGNS